MLRAALEAHNDSQRDGNGWDRWKGATESIFDFDQCVLRDCVGDSLRTIYWKDRELTAQAEHLLTAWICSLQALATFESTDRWLDRAADEFMLAWPSVNVTVGAGLSEWYWDLKTSREDIRVALNDRLRSSGKTGHWLVLDLVRAVLAWHSVCDGSSWPVPLPLLFVTEHVERRSARLGDCYLRAEPLPLRGILPRPSLLGFCLLADNWQNALQRAWKTAMETSLAEFAGVVWWWLLPSGGSPFGVVEDRSAEAAFFCGIRSALESKKLNSRWLMTGCIGAKTNKGHELEPAGSVRVKLDISKEEYKRRFKGIFLSDRQPEVDWLDVSVLKIEPYHTVEGLYERATKDAVLEEGLDLHNSVLARQLEAGLGNTCYLKPQLLIAPKDKNVFDNTLTVEHSLETGGGRDADRVSPLRLVRSNDRQTCVIADSGLGKTEFARWIQYALSVDHGLISATFAANLSQVSRCELEQIG